MIDSLTKKFDGKNYNFLDLIVRKDDAHKYVKFLKSAGHNVRVSKLDSKYAVWIRRGK